MNVMSENTQARPGQRETDCARHQAVKEIISRADCGSLDNVEWLLDRVRLNAEDRS